MKHVLLVGAGPLPEADTTLTCSYNLRSVKIARGLREAGIPLRLVAVDIFQDFSGPVGSRASLAGDYVLLSNDTGGRESLGQILRETQPKAIIAVSYEPAAMVCELDHNIPVWADMPGWIMAEAQLKAAEAGDDAFLDRFRDREQSVLRRADVISVVSQNQRHATVGELALLGRLNRRNIDYRLVRVLPSIAMNWRTVVGDSTETSDFSGAVNLPPDAPVLLWSGGYNLWTNAERIFALIADLMQSIPELHFVSTGGHIPGHNERLWDRIHSLGGAGQFRERIHILPWLPFRQALGWLDRAALGLCVDGDNIEIDYGSRTRVVDMLAHGLPVATTTGTELASDLARDGAIIALRPDEPEQWPGQIERNLRSPERLKQLAERGRRAMDERYSFRTTGGILLEWLKNPQRAPDLTFRDRSQPSAVDANRDTEGGDCHHFKHEHPMVTWEPQTRIESIARRVLDPYTPGRLSRMAQGAFRGLLSHGTTRRVTLAAWGMASRALRPERAVRWQSRVDDWMKDAIAVGDPGHPHHQIGRSVYTRALPGSRSNRQAKAVNILLARHEFDLPGDLRCLPQRIEIEAISACNLRCRMCKIPYVQKPALMLSRRHFDRITPYLKYAVTFEIIGEGEPTLNPDLAHFLAEGSRHGCYMRLFTNGTRLTPELSSTFVGSGLDTIVFSVFAGRPEVYRAIVGSDSFDRVIQNARDLRDIKRMRASQCPRMFINCPLIADSLESAPELVQLAGMLGFECVNFGAAFIFRPEMESESIFKMDPNQVKEVFAECAAIGRRKGIRVILPPIDRTEPDHNAGDLRENGFGCLFPWQSVTIRANGDAEVCTYNRKITGNLEEMTLMEIWNGEQQRRFRDGHTSHNGVDYCKMCYHHCFRAKHFKQACVFPYDLGMYGY